jgi:hypothetical protein
MRNQCQQAIYSYADEQCQRNAALTGEHAEYVRLVLQLLRDEYKVQVTAGATEFTVPEGIHELLTQECPWR